MIKNGDNVILKFSTLWDGELCRDHGKAYIYPSMDRAMQYCNPDHEVLVEYAPVKHGHWIKFQFLGCGPTYECSVCGKLHDQDYNFCNNCGAKMDEE